MLILLKEIERLDKLLSGLLDSKDLVDYRIALNANNSISAVIVSALSPESIVTKLGSFAQQDIEVVSPDDFKADYDMYQHLFENDSKVVYQNSRRRLSSLLQPIKKTPQPFPVVTFYSYKGGVGRSTTLAACASHLAIHHKKKVVILDCDFEAPGFTNFFLEDFSAPIFNEGIVEYFIDSDYVQPTLSHYYWMPSKSYSGEGEIYVFPAGNLENQDIVGHLFPTNLKHYLEGLSRLDTISQHSLRDKFAGLFQQIKQELDPDVVLIDSRTGFNDIFGVSAFKLSNLVIGFFGSNVQSLPGLYFFLNTISQEDSPSLLAVNSIIPDTGRKSKFAVFCDIVDDYLGKISDNEESGYAVEKHYISRNNVLSALGTPEEDPIDFIDLVSNCTFADYSQLFDIVNSRIDNVRNKKSASNTPSAKGNAKTSAKSQKLQLKEKILSDLHDKIPKLYAQQIDDFDKEYEENRYFYRKCMIELFNPGKILVIGNKGTGKSYIYQSLQNQKIVAELKKRANKETLECMFIQMINSRKWFDTLKFNDTDHSGENFFERFWTIYIWDSLMLETPYGYKSKIPTFAITDDHRTMQRFAEIASDINMLISIEDDLAALDAYLKDIGKNIVIIFDDLDQVVKPDLWPDRIAPLINICRRFKYSSIHPKLFLRSDLFDRITNLNNKNELNNRSVSIEWTRQELFAYFFKQILSNSKDEFVKLMKLYGLYPNQYINKIVNSIAENDINQPLDDYSLRHLCAVFFGRYANETDSDRFDETYNWIFTNLRNANGTISLRPFIDLLTIALGNAEKGNNEEYPILPQRYYLGGAVRAKAVERHFNDLACDRGNEDLIPIFEYIRDKANPKYKLVTLYQDEMNRLLDDILRHTELKDNKDRDSIISFLKVNGIIRQRIVRDSKKRVHNLYQFAFLYKYSLGLKTR